MDTNFTIACDVACDLVMTNENGDYAYEYDEDRHLARVALEASKFNLVSQMVDPCGPGGGHPVYEFTGTRDDLEKFLVDFMGEAREDVHYYFDE